MRRKMTKTLAVLLCLMTVVAFMPTFAFANASNTTAADQSDNPSSTEILNEDASGENSEQLEVGTEAKETTGAAEADNSGEELKTQSEPAADIDVTLTVNNKGVLAKDKNNKAVANVDVTVEDINSDGNLTFDEALVAAHKAYAKNGESDYVVEVGAYGASVAKLWGVSTYNTLFFINGKGITTGVQDDAVQDGDKLYASINADDSNYADWYTCFNKETKTVGVNEEFSLNLKGFQGMAGGTAKAAGGVEVKAIDKTSGDEIELASTETDSDGDASLTFSKAGTYIVTASGSVHDTWNDWSGKEISADCPIMAPVCIVTVEATARAEATVYLTVSNRGTIAKDKDSNSMNAKEVSVKDIDGDGYFTFDEVLVAAHDTYLEGGADDNYDCSSYVTKLWGVSTYNTLFFINGEGLSTGVKDDKVNAGDRLIASINADDSTYADVFTFFNVDEKSVDVGETFTLTLKGYLGMAYTEEDKTPKAISEVAIGTSDAGEFTQIQHKETNSNGKVTLQFDKKGTYYVSAKGTTPIVAWGTTVDAPIIAPLCKVTVGDENAGIIAKLKKMIAMLKAEAIYPNAKAFATGTKSMKLNWSSSEHASGYEISLDNGNTWTDIAGTEKSFAGLSPATTYKYQVRGYVLVDGEDSERVYSDISAASAATPLARVGTPSLKAKSKKLTASWGAVEGAAAYQVWIGTNSSVTKGLVKYSTSSLSKTSKKLKKNKNYYVKVRAYKGGVYGAWSPAKKIKCK